MQPANVRASTVASVSPVNSLTQASWNRGPHPHPVFRRQPASASASVSEGKKAGNDKGLLTRESILYANLCRLSNIKFQYIRYWPANMRYLPTTVLSELANGGLHNALFAVRLPGGRGVHMHPPYEHRLHHGDLPPGLGTVQYEQLAPDLYIIASDPGGVALTLILNGEQLAFDSSEEKIRLALAMVERL